MKNILVVPDISGWVMESIAKGIINSCLRDKFQFDIKYSDKSVEKQGKPLINWAVDLQNYDLIYLMTSGYLPKNLKDKDYKRIVTTFHGGPGTEAQANILQRMGRTNMRISYVSGQTKDRVINPTYSSSEKMDAIVDITKKLNIEDLKKRLKLSEDDSLKIEPINSNHLENLKGEIEVRARFVKHSFGLKKLYYTPQGVDIEKFNQKDIIEDFVCGYAGWVRYLIGNQSEHRRGDWIIKAWQKSMKNFKLNIAGGLKNIGGGIDSIKPFRKKYGDNNLKVNLYNSGGMVGFYKGISCYLVPDKFAGGPMPVLEAGAMGIPVITTKCGHCGDFIEDNIHGKVINNFEEFVDAIKFMKGRPVIRRNMGKNLQEYIREHRTWNAVAPYWEKFFNGV
jgi:glycosyltransferase involved in cell wall biosynthesis